MYKTKKTSLSLYNVDRQVYLLGAAYAETHTLYPNHKVEQSLPTCGFHLLKFAAVILYNFSIVAQVFPETTLCHFLHAQTAPGCVGVGTEAVHPVGLGVDEVGLTVGVPGMPIQ
jgi:hypothetical protein